MNNLLKNFLTFIFFFYSTFLCAEEWIYYGTVCIPPGKLIDNPIPNNLGIEGEIKSLPYTVPNGYKLILKYIQVEGPDSPQLGLGVWIGDFPCTNQKWVISCTTTGGSRDLSGLKIIIPEEKKVNIRMMNNTNIPWENGFCVQGELISAQNL